MAEHKRGHENCVCECEHEHQHHHPHEHEHENCGCGHEHHKHDCEHGVHHTHSHDGGCSCCDTGFGDLSSHADGGGFVKEHRCELVLLIAGAALFVAGLIMEHINWVAVSNTAIPAIGESNMATLAICIVAYLILGHGVLLKSAQNIARGQVFDENFLMSVATLASFGIGDFPEAVGVMLFYNIGELFEHISVDRSRKQIAEVVDMRPETVNLIKDWSSESEQTILTLSNGETVETPAEEVMPKDVILIKAGDRIPLDGIVLKGEGIIDTAPITGEPTPVHAKEGERILSGCINKRGQFAMQVTEGLEESMVSRILRSVEGAADNKPEIEKFISKFSRIYTPIVVGMAAFVALIPPIMMGAAWKYWVMTAVTFLVISCPCAMLISVPLAYFLGVGAASRYGILVKSGHALEALRNVKLVALDKTGTLTEGVVEDECLLNINFESEFAKKTVSGDVLKADAKTGVAKIHDLRVKTAMLTGDRAERAKSVASEAGIEATNIKAELLPDEKLSALLELRSTYGAVMFVGDGINDAPVLAGADVGGAMGSGADAAIEYADIVFMNSKVGGIARIIQIAKRTGSIAKQNIVLALGIKILVILLGLMGFANIWLAVMADTGVAMICILNSLRLLKAMDKLNT